jgi:hypothetical protein
MRLPLEPRGDDEYEERRAVQRFVDARPPALAPDDVVTVDEEREVGAELQADLLLERGVEACEGAVMLVVRMGVAEERRRVGHVETRLSD